MSFSLKTILPLLFILNFGRISQCQSIVDFFRLLPAYCTPNLNYKAKELLIINGEYTLPVGASAEIYHINDVDSSNYLSYETQFIAPRNAFNFYEIRRFKKANGKFILVFSCYGGLLRSSCQQDLRVFDISNGKLIENQQNLLPKEIPISNFLKQDTPDSIAIKLKKSLSSHYDLSEKETSPAEIEFTIYPEYLIYEDQILRYSIFFKWTGTSFIRSYKSEE